MLATLKLDARRTGNQMPDPHRLGKVRWRNACSGYRQLAVPGAQIHGRHQGRAGRASTS